MLSRSLGVFASLALAANSVLLPPSVAVHDLGDDNALEAFAINPFKRTVSVECPGCPQAIKLGDALTWVDGDPQLTYLLDFEIGPNEDSLNIDGVQLYPPIFGHFPEPFFVRQVNFEGSDSVESIRLRVTGYTFHYNSAETISDSGVELLPMTFRITGIESKVVNPPVLTINLLKDSEGRLMIASFETTESTPGSPTDQKKECEEWPMMCKWKSMFTDKVDGFKKGCGKFRGSLAGKPGYHADGPFRRPHTPYHGGSYRPQFHQSKFQRVLRRVFYTVLLPILVGILAGTFTYLVGMALGCAIAVVVNKVRGQKAYVSLPQDDERYVANEDGKDSEKEVYSEPPVYEAPPVYEEAVEKEVVDESK